MSPFGLPDHRLSAFARPVLGYLPVGFNAGDAAKAEIGDVGSRAALSTPDVVAARIARLGVNASTLIDLGSFNYSASQRVGIDSKMWSAMPSAVRSVVIYSLPERVAYGTANLTG